MILWSDNPEWWRFLGLYLGMMTTFCLPYGSRTPYPVKFAVGCSYALPMLFIGINPWMALIPVLFILLFWLSNKSGFFANTVVWKIWEFVIGGIVSISVAYFIHDKNEWLMIAIMGSGATLFAVGGTGFKPARRFIMPFILTGLLAWGFNL